MYSKEDTLLKNDYRVGGYQPNYKVNCFTCGDEFYATTDRAKYCSQRCVNDAAISRRKKLKELEREKICPICNEPFKAKRKDSLYCSPKCKQKAYRTSVTDKGLGRSCHNWKQ